MRLWKNPDWTDQQIERRKQNQADKLYDRMSTKWRDTAAISDTDMIAEILEDCKPSDMNDTIVITHVIEKFKKESGREPNLEFTPFIEKRDGDYKKIHLANGSTLAIISQIRRSPNHGYLVAASGVLPDPDMGNCQRSIHINIKKYRDKIPEAQLQIFEKMDRIAESNIATREETRAALKANLAKSEKQRLQEKRDEIKRRRNRGI